MDGYRRHCWYCEGRGQAPAWRTGLTHDSICPKCSGSGFADSALEERDRTIATLRAELAAREAEVARLEAVAREIAEGDPIQHIEAHFDSGDDVHQCRYCGATQGWPYDAPIHDLTCVYVRALAALAAPPGDGDAKGGEDAAQA